MRRRDQVIYLKCTGLSAGITLVLLISMAKMRLFLNKITIYLVVATLAHSNTSWANEAVKFGFKDPTANTALRRNLFQAWLTLSQGIA
jgi:hypothetical protein